jgi:hypothetical protein
VYISIGSGSVTEELGLHLDRALVSSRSTATVHEVLEILAQIFALASEPMSLTHFANSCDTAGRRLALELLYTLSSDRAKNFGPHLRFL